MAEYNKSADVGANPELDAALSQMEAEARVAVEAHERFTQTDSYQSVLKSKYRRYHFYYAPPYGDQWPEDLAQRPGKIHATANIVKPAVNIDARIQALLPRISLAPDGLSEDQRQRAEAAEKLMLTWLDLSGWEVWMGTLTRAKSIYGKGIIKAFWNKEAKRPDARVVENPGNLRIGWGSSDFSVMDWALYEYSISPQEAMVRFPGTLITKNGEDGKLHLQIMVESNHADPLNQSSPMRSADNLSRPLPYQPSDYESKQVAVWDYWYKKPNGKGGFTVCNAMFIGGLLVKPAGQKVPLMEHAYLPDIPYIVIPQDTEPGNPEGLSLVEDLIDLQVELNRAMAHWMQLVADEIDPAWVLEGDNADSIPPGMVPKGGEVLAAGTGNKLRPLDKGVNIFPVAELVKSIWEHYHKISGLSEILYGQVPGAQTSGRAVAIQVEAAANRLDPRRRLLYAGLRELLVFWTIMAERVNPKMPVGVDEETNKTIYAGVKDIVAGYRRWKIVAPEITPRDLIENTQNELNKVQGNLSSLRSAMDAIGQDSPEAELDLIRQEKMDAQLNPASVQAYTALLIQMQQLQAQQQAMQQQLQQLPLGAGPGQGGYPQPPGGPPGGAVAQGETAVNAVQQAQFAAQPQAVAEDQNQPMTQAGSPPPAAGQGPASTTLIRGGEALNQLAFRG